jgi:hypothetical protein
MILSCALKYENWYLPVKVYDLTQNHRSRSRRLLAIITDQFTVSAVKDKRSAVND